MDARGGLPGFEERFAEARGCRLRYLVAGEGEPLVLAHGLGGAAANWLALAPLLLPGRRVLVPELPGHGGPARPSGPPRPYAQSGPDAPPIERPAGGVGGPPRRAVAPRPAVCPPP